MGICRFKCAGRSEVLEVSPRQEGLLTTPTSTPPITEVRDTSLSVHANWNLPGDGDHRPSSPHLCCSRLCHQWRPLFSADGRGPAAGWMAFTPSAARELWSPPTPDDEAVHWLCKNALDRQLVMCLPHELLKPIHFPQWWS